MAFRFRKRVRIAPGLHLNASGSGLDLSIGPCGASVSVGPRGTYLNSSIPGTGLYSRERIGGDRSAGNAQRQMQPLRRNQSADADRAVLQSLTVHGIGAQFDGEGGPVLLLDHLGSPLAPATAALVWRYLREPVIEQLKQQLEDKRKAIDALGDIHLRTPSPDPVPPIPRTEFDDGSPSPPTPQQYHWFKRLFPAHRLAVDEANQRNAQNHERQLQDWRTRKEAHDQEMAERQRYDAMRFSSIRADLEAFLAWHLTRLDWPKETEVAFELSADASILLLDVDLPEIADFPDSYYTLLASGKEFRAKKIPDATRRTLYMRHVHGVGLRLVGEALAHVPRLQAVIVSAFSQRPNRATGAIEDQYLYSSRIGRVDWGRIDFAGLARMDPAAAYDLFETRRKVSKTGVFQAIEPITL
jgi:hypothetical protein